MATLHIGDRAPDLCLSDYLGRSYTLKAYKGHPVVLYFYPKDNTPGCTIEAREFSKLARAFSRIGVKVLGVSGGDERTKRKFCEEHTLSIPLLSDTDFVVSKAYGVYGTKTFMGRKYKGIKRTTFLVDSSGKVRKIFHVQQVEGHASEVLEVVKQVAKPKPRRTLRTPRGSRTKRIQAGRGRST